MSDPASLEVSVSVTGMDLNEATALLRAMPAGSRWNGVATRPALGGIRYAADITGLSVAGAEGLVAALADHTRAVGGSE